MIIVRCLQLKDKIASEMRIEDVKPKYESFILHNKKVSTKFILSNSAY